MRHDDQVFRLRIKARNMYMRVRQIAWDYVKRDIEPLTRKF